MSLINKLSQAARSEKGRELVGKAKGIANDPKTREKLDGARGKLNDQLGAAKHKLAEKRGTDAAAPTTQAPPPPHDSGEGPKAA